MMAHQTTMTAQTRKNINLIPGLMEQTAKHDRFLFGNGEPGIDERMRNIEKWIEFQIKREEERREWWRKLQWVIIPMVVTFVFGFVVQFVTFWVRVVPELAK